MCAASLLAAEAVGADPIPAPKDPAVGMGSTEVGSALARVARNIGQQLKKDGTGARVFVAPLRSDEPSPRSNELVARVASLVGGSVVGSAGFNGDPVTLATAHALSRRAKRFVYVQPEVQRGALHASVDVFTVTSNAWDRVRQLAPVPIAHAFAVERIDAEVRSYLAPISLLTGQIEHVWTEERELLAVACADVDGDGSLEIITLSRYRAAVGRARGGRFMPSATAVLRDLVAVAPSPLREPLASIVVLPPSSTAPGRIDVGISDRAAGIRFDANLRPRGEIWGIPFPSAPGDVCARFEGTVLGGTLAACDATGPVPDDLPGTVSIDALYEAAIVSASGAVVAVRAIHNPSTGELELEAGSARANLPHTGAQIAVADLDGDGAPEILSSLETLPPPPAPSAEKLPEHPPEPDALVVSTWQPGSAPRERLRVPVPGGVRALTACPADGLGPNAVLVATGGELWVIR